MLSREFNKPVNRGAHKIFQYNELPDSAFIWAFFQSSSATFMRLIHSYRFWIKAQLPFHKTKNKKTKMLIVMSLYWIQGFKADPNLQVCTPTFPSN